MLSAHTERVKFRKTHEQFLKLDQRYLIELWKEMNLVFRLSIPEEHFNNLGALPVTAFTEVDESVIMLCYSTGSIHSSLQFSINLLDRFGNMLHFTQPCLRNEEDLHTFTIREGANNFQKPGFFWISISNAPTEYINCTSLINWVQSQNEYRMPTFELIQSMIMYPEMLLHINGLMGPHLGILGLSRDVLKPGSVSSALTPSFAPGVGVLSTNQCKSHDKLKVVQLKNFPENDNLKNKNILCRLIRNIPTE